MAGNHILVIDDSSVISSLLDDFLTEKGFQVSLAGTAEEAYSKIRENIPNLIVLDLVLPDIHGLQFCRVLKSDPRTHHIPVIMATAKAIEVKDKVEGLKAGADDYVTKPFELTELFERINAVLRRVELERGRAREVVATPPSLQVETEEEPMETLAPPSSGTWEILTGILVEPTWTFSSLFKESPEGKLSLSFRIVILIPLFLMAGRLLKAGPQLGAEALSSLLFILAILSIWMIFSGALTLLISLIGKKTHFKSIASVIGLGCLPLALEKALEFVYVLSGGRPGEFSADPTLIFSGFSLMTAPGLLVRGLDVFALWGATLVGLGFSLLYGCNKKKTVALISCFWILAIGTGMAWAYWMGVHH